MSIAMTVPANSKSARAGRTPRETVARVASLPAARAAMDWLRDQEKKFCEWQLEMSAIPAPPFQEAERAAWLRRRFEELGLQATHIDEAGNVIGMRPGLISAAPCVAVTAHIDTVLSPGNIPVRRQGRKLTGPGICDNGAGVTALLALAGCLEASGVKHSASIVFIGSVGEEGEGDLRGMRHIFSQSHWKEEIAHTLVVDGAGTESVVPRALGSRRFEVTVRGRGGHSWSDFGEPNPIVTLAHAIVEFYKTEGSQQAGARSAYNVGAISGGGSVNAIPQSASMRVDLRSESAAELDRLERDLRTAVAASASAELGDQASRLAKPRGNGDRGMECEIRCIGDRPSARLSEDSRLLHVVRAVDAYLGIESKLHCSSTDANIPLALGREAVSVGAGGSGGAAHSVEEWYDPAGRELGLHRILLAVLALAETLPAAD
jgi:tripeptide aminopeptidase